MSMYLHYATGDCQLGKLLVASCGQKIVAVLMGDDLPALVSDLANRFPEAQMQEANADMHGLFQQVVKCIDHPHSAPLGLTLGPIGTLFQKRVWTALCDVPSGTTVTYKQLAERINAPRAVRAVAGACAANPIAVLIPCHRVLRSDGGLSGYRWGVERKRLLLQMEADGNHFSSLRL